MIKVIFIGDIVGKPGRKAVAQALGVLRARHSADCVIANAENAAGGSGVTPGVVEELIGCGINVLTSGDHIWRNREVFKVIGREERLLRAANFPPEAPGHGSVLVTLERGVTIGVVNVLGRVFMNPVESPFLAAAREIEAVGKAGAIIVDFHAEATSEKIAMGRYLDGKVAAVVGTHTHVQTADEQVFPGGTAYITDAGMTGSCVSVLGREISPVVTHFLTQMPQRFTLAKTGVELQGVLITADEKSGKAVAIERIREKVGE